MGPAVTLAGGRIVATVGGVITVASALYLSARAVYVPLTYDEASSFSRYVDADWPALFDFASATNHLLNSVLTKAAHAALGDRPWVLRLPNVLAGLGYLAFAAALAARLRFPAIGLAGLIVLATNPYLLEHFALSRGYGLAMALLIASMHFILRWSDRPAGAIASRRDLAWTLATAGAAVVANFGTVPAFVAILLVIVARLASAPRLTASPLAERPFAPSWREVAGWAIVATLFTGSVFARERVWSADSFEPITMRVVGLFEEELAAIRVFRFDSTGRLRELPRRPGGMWHSGPVHDDWRLRVVLPVAVDQNLAALDVTMGAETFRRDRRSPGPWTAYDLGSDRVLEPTGAQAWSGGPVHWRHVAIHTGVTVAILATLGVVLVILARICIRARAVGTGDARIVIRAVVAVATVTAGPLYLLRRDGQLFFGGTTGVVADTVGSLVTGTAYGAVPAPAVAGLTLALLILAATILLVMLARSAPAGAHRPFRGAALGLAVLIPIAAQIVLQHRLLGTPYPTGRTAIYLLPLLLLFLVMFAGALATAGRVVRGLVTFVMLVLAAGSTWNLVRAANLSRTLDWPQDRSTVEMLNEVVHSTQAADSPARLVRVGVDWMFYPVARYYAERQSTAQTRYEVIVLPGDGLPVAFAYVLAGSDRPKGTELRRFPDSGAGLYKMF